jgi:hypothetical protein
MKITHDDDLSTLHKYTQNLAKEIANTHVNLITTLIMELIKNDSKFGDLTYSGLMTFINTISTHILCKIFIFSCHLGKQFPDTEHSSRDNFEDIISGLRHMMNFNEINKNEYLPGIKKIKIT